MQKNGDGNKIPGVSIKWSVSSIYLEMCHTIWKMDYVYICNYNKVLNVIAVFMSQTLINFENI